MRGSDDMRFALVFQVRSLAFVSAARARYWSRFAAVRTFLREEKKSCRLVLARSL